MSKHIELAKKLKELSERGVDGEKENAEQLLNKMMRKYKFSMEDIEDEERRDNQFTVPLQYRKLFVHIAGTILGKDVKLYPAQGLSNTYLIETTSAEVIELNAKYEFYRDEYVKGMDMYLIAFLKANKLYIKDNSPRESVNWDNLTDEQKKKAILLEIMSKGIQKSEYLKQIENENK